MFESVVFKAHDDNLNEIGLEFSIRKTLVAQRWSTSLCKANEQSKIREGRRWYNFPGYPNSDAVAIENRIQQAITNLNESSPGLIEERVRGENFQEYVNRVHVHFADSDSDRITRSRAEGNALKDLNNSLHAYESCLRSQITKKISGIPECNIVLTWENPFFEQLEFADYDQFTVAKKFGTIYINYCHIGRHLYELFLSKDDFARDDHIIPSRRFSADSYIWFGSTTGPNSLALREKAIESWFFSNSARLNSLGFYWGDPKNAIGWIPVADLVGDFSDLTRKLELIRSLGEMREVSALFPV